MSGQNAVVRGMLGQVAWILIPGIGLGLGTGLVIPANVEKLLFGIAPRDPWTLGVAATVLAVVALAAAFVPVRRAARVDPVVALRAD
jgi:ABC-type antimicrobial peptide transport system permease subunit